MSGDRVEIRTMKDNRVALIDLDGTVADYDKSMTAWMHSIQHPTEEPYAGRLVNKGKEIEPPYVEARRKLIQRTPGFWRDLEWLPNGRVVVEMLREIGFSLHVLTKGPSSSFNAYSEKVEWCAKNIPDANVTLAGDKSLVYGRVLVDDWPDYFNPWLTRRPRGLVVCVEQPWNRDVKHPRVCIFNGRNALELYDRFSHAYERESGAE